MASKVIIALCAQAILAQIAFSQCLSGANWAGGYGLGAGYGLGLDGWNGYGLGAGCGCGGVASTGGGLAVGSASPIPPVGLSVLSENVYEGGLCVGGNLPFLGTVGLEGILPTAGAGAVSYGCGNGAAGIVEEGSIFTGITAPGSYGPGVGIAGAGIGGLGYGLGAIDGFGLGGLNGCGLGGINGYGVGLGAIDGYGLGGINGYGLGGIAGGCGCGGLWL